MPQKTNTWSYQDDELLLRERNTRGRFWTAIAEMLDRDPDVCRQRYIDLMHAKLAAKKKTTPTKVRCLGPLAPFPHYFMSENKAKYRLCPTCRAWNASQGDHSIDIIDDVDIGITNEPDVDEIDSTEANDLDLNKQEEIVVTTKHSEDIVPVDTYSRMLKRGQFRDEPSNEEEDGSE